MWQPNGLENGRGAAHIRIWPVKHRCPVCGREGLADMSGAKSYKIGDYDTRVDAVTEGFAIKNKTEVVWTFRLSDATIASP
jgi:hypothetical protein